MRSEVDHSALVQYGRLRRELEPHVDDLLALGVADMRPPAMPERFSQALGAVGAVGGRHGGSVGRAIHRQVASMEDTGPPGVSGSTRRRYRVLTWDRASRAAQEQSEKVDDDWANAPLETLASVLESYLAGG